jgi:hypothetical protein
LNRNVLVEPESTELSIDSREETTDAALEMPPENISDVGVTVRTAVAVGL